MKRRRRVGLVAWLHALLLALLCTGCVFPVPPGETGRENIADTVPAFIAPGRTTREDVLLALGEPDGESNFQKRFLYYRISSHGGIGFLFVAGSGGMMGTSEQETYHRLVVEFDEAGIVSGAYFAHDTCGVGRFAINNAGGESAPCADVARRGPLAENPALAGVVHALVFERVDWFEGVDGLRGRSLFAGMSERPRNDGTLVLGPARLLYFAAGADAATMPLASWDYAQIRAQRVDASGGRERLVIVGEDGHPDSFEFRAAAPVAPIAEALAARLQSAGGALPAPTPP